MKSGRRGHSRDKTHAVRPTRTDGFGQPFIGPIAALGVLRSYAATVCEALERRQQVLVHAYTDERQAITYLFSEWDEGLRITPRSISAGLRFKGKTRFVRVLWDDVRFVSVDYDGEAGTAQHFVDRAQAWRLLREDAEALYSVARPSDRDTHEVHDTLRRALLNTHEQHGQRLLGGRKSWVSHLVHRPWWKDAKEIARRQRMMAIVEADERAIAAAELPLSPPPTLGPGSVVRYAPGMMRAVFGLHDTHGIPKDRNYLPVEQQFVVQACSCWLCGSGRFLAIPHQSPEIAATSESPLRHILRTNVEQVADALVMR